MYKARRVSLSPDSSIMAELIVNGQQPGTCNSAKLYPPAIRDVKSDFEFKLHLNDKIDILALKLSQLRRQVNIKQTVESKPPPWFRCLWFLACSAACSYQLYYMTNLYLSWQMNAETYYFPTDPIVPPSLIICGSHLYKVPCHREECLKYRNTSRMFFESSYDFEDIFAAVNLVSPSDVHLLLVGADLMDFKAKAVKKFRFTYFICFRIDILKFFGNASQQYTQQFIRNNAMPAVLSLVLSPKFEKNVSTMPIAMAPEGQELVRIQDSMFFAKPDKMTLLTYSSHSMKLLPSPYASDCFDYEANGQVSQDWCHQVCALANVRAFKMPIPEEISYWDVDDQLFATTQTSDETKRILYNPCGESCSKLSCKLAYVFGRSIGSFEGAGDSTSIHLILSSEPELQVTYNPKMTVGEYLAFIGSVLGLWLGFSALNIFDVSVSAYMSKQRNNAKLEPLQTIAMRGRAKLSG